MSSSAKVSVGGIFPEAMARSCLMEFVKKFTLLIRTPECYLAMGLKQRSGMKSNQIHLFILRNSALDKSA